MKVSQYKVPNLLKKVLDGSPEIKYRTGIRNGRRGACMMEIDQKTWELLDNHAVDQMFDIFFDPAKTEVELE